MVGPVEGFLRLPRAAGCPIVVPPDRAGPVEGVFGLPRSAGWLIVEVPPDVRPAPVAPVEGLFGLDRFISFKISSSRSFFDFSFPTSMNVSKLYQDPKSSSKLGTN